MDHGLPLELGQLGLPLELGQLGLTLGLLEEAGLEIQLFKFLVWHQLFKSLRLWVIVIPTH